MLESLDPLLNQLPPKTAKALIQAIAKCSKEIAIPTDWVQRWIAFTVIADGLAAYTPEGERLFEFKGGAAIEMRLRQLKSKDDRIQPRATRDLDATYRGHLEDIETSVRTALATLVITLRFA